LSTPIALARIRIVLSQTSHPGNIGAAARAMKTMGLQRLYLVQPKLFPHAEAEALASGAQDVLQRAIVCDSLDEALKGTIRAVAATGRHRDLTHPILACREAAAQMVADSAQGEIALVFGPERSGLTVADINRCQLLASIAADEHYGSLNLAQAVQVFAYELRLAALDQIEFPQHQAEAITHEEAEFFYAHLEQTLYATRFLDPAQPKRLMQRMRRLFARARLEREEVNILRGFLSAVNERCASDKSK
jgi:tRNA/rRNA methyltransferase